MTKSHSGATKPQRRSKNKLHPVLSDFITNELAYAYLRYLNCPRALSVAILHSSGEHRQLVDLTFVPSNYDSHEEMRKACLATELFSKYDRLETGIDTREVGILNARKAEALNESTNAVFDAISRNLAVPTDSTILGILLNSRKIIHNVLGSRPPSLSFEKWGPGRTTSAFGPNVDTGSKFRCKPDITVAAFSYGISTINRLPLWAASLLDADGPCSMLPKLSNVNLVEGNVAITVPKNAKTDRFICYEPHVNSALQLSVGSFLRKRLLERCGLDLTDQSVNQELARIGSLTGELATIDLSMASDTLSRSLVQFLLPEDWYHFLDCLRSRSTQWSENGPFELNQKFSSMGNGFTFELETLVFYSLALAVCPSLIVGVNFTVYGDDIVLPTSMVNEMTKVLSFAGFSVNTKKSHFSSYFRESCGCYAIAGRKFAVPRLRPGRQASLNHRLLYNQIIQHYVDWFGYVPSRLYSILRARRDCTPYPKPFGPMGHGDGHYYATFDEARPRRHPKGWDGFSFCTLAVKSRPRQRPWVEGERPWYYSSILASLHNLFYGSVEKTWVSESYHDHVVLGFAPLTWREFLVA